MNRSLEAKRLTVFRANNKNNKNLEQRDRSKRNPWLLGFGQKVPVQIESAEIEANEVL